MITYQTGNIFSSKAQVLVNPVNTVGVMGKGLALAFKEKYPRMFRVYKTLCRDGLLRVGFPWLWSDTEGHYVLLFPTKVHWKYFSRVEYIEEGLQSFAARIEGHAYGFPITSIAFPTLGCGLGGLDFRTQVKPLMETYLSNLPIAVEVYSGGR